ncbi:MAG: hypothetical protein WA705_22950 [Candidatus Ozemobacteraceae bacterium]
MPLRGRKIRNNAFVQLSESPEARAEGEMKQDCLLASLAMKKKGVPCIIVRSEATRQYHDNNNSSPISPCGKLIFSGLALAWFMSFFIGGAAFAWVPLLQRSADQKAFIPQHGRAASSPQRVLLDPDDWSNAEITAMKKAGCEPMGWFNIAARESGRTISEQIEQKWLVLPKLGPKPEPAPGRFYLEAWQRLHLTRLDEIGHKGFSSVVLAGIETVERITNQPTIQTEMTRWIQHVAAHFKGLGLSTRRLYLYFPEGYPLPKTLPTGIDGVIVEGYWYNGSGRNMHPWAREEFLKTCCIRKVAVLTLDNVPGEEEADRVRAESGAQGFDAGFGIVPLAARIRRSPIDAPKAPSTSDRRK